MSRVEGSDDQYKITRDLQQGLARLQAQLALPAWQVVGVTGQPAFQNAWANFGGAYSVAAFRRDGLSLVHLKGVLTAPASPNTKVIFTLPPGCRPLETRIFTCLQSGGVGRVDVAADGTVTCQTGTGAGFFTLDGIVFQAEQ